MTRPTPFAGFLPGLAALMSSIVCVCCVSRCLQERRHFHEALEDHGQHVNFNAEFIFAMLRAKCPLDTRISDKQLEMGASSLKVRACHSSSAPLLQRIVLPVWRHGASECLPQQLSLAVKKSDSHARTPG